MTAASHALIGTVIAAKIGNPALAIPVAIASHFIADAIPHWDTATNGNGKHNLTRAVFYNTIADITLGFILSFLLIYFIFPQTNLFYTFLIIIMAQLPDYLTGPYYFFRIEKPLFKNTYKLQKVFDRKLDKPWGIVTQVTFVLLVIILGIVF